MDEKKKRELVMREIFPTIEKIHALGREVGTEHLSHSSISLMYLGGEKKRGDETSFPFSVEIERVSEFGRRLFWYYGTIAVRKDGSIKSDLHMHEDSAMDVFGWGEGRKRIEKKVEAIRKKLSLPVSRKEKTGG